MIILNCYCDPQVAPECPKCNLLNAELLSAAADVDQSEIEDLLGELSEPQDPPAVVEDVAPDAAADTIGTHDWPTPTDEPSPSAEPPPSGSGSSAGPAKSRKRSKKGSSPGESSSDGPSPAESGDRG